MLHFILLLFSADLHRRVLRFNIVAMKEKGRISGEIYLRYFSLLYPSAIKSYNFTKFEEIVFTMLLT